MAEISITLTSEKINFHESDELKIIKAARQDPKVFGELYKRYVEKIKQHSHLIAILRH